MVIEFKPKITMIELSKMSQDEMLLYFRSKLTEKNKEKELLLKDFITRDTKHRKAMNNLKSQLDYARTVINSLREENTKLKYGDVTDEILKQMKIEEKKEKKRAYEKTPQRRKYRHEYYNRPEVQKRDWSKRHKGWENKS